MSLASGALALVAEVMKNRDNTHLDLFYNECTLRSNAIIKERLDCVSDTTSNSVYYFIKVLRFEKKIQVDETMTACHDNFRVRLTRFNTIIYKYI